MDHQTTTSEYVVLDACCLINLLESGRIHEILSSLSMVAVVADYVWSEEVIRTTKSESLMPEQSRPDVGLLKVSSLQSEDEQQTFVNLAARLDDGEAISAAIAIQRSWRLATDDRRARTVVGNYAPNIQLLSTPELVKIWVDRTSPAKDEVRELIQRIRHNGHFMPPANHHLITWWLGYLD